MSYGKFGSRPRSMSNPVYWVGRHLQEERRRTASEQATEKFNERWRRLNDVYQNLAEYFVMPLNGRPLHKKEYERYVACVDAATRQREFILDNLDTCSPAELSKYATTLKKLALISFQLCKKLQVYGDIESIAYETSTKSILLNNTPIYFLG